MFLAIHIRDCTAEAHAAMLDCASAFSPRVEDTGPDAVVLDIEGLDRIFGSMQEIAGQLAQRVSECGLQPSLAIAANPDAAVMAARAKAGITIIEDGQEAARLKDFPIELLHLDEDAFETLSRWGIHTLGALARLPLKEISQRMGQAGVRLHQLARGGVSRPLVPQMPPLHFEEVMDLDDAIDLLEPLTFILSRLLDQLFKRLRRRGLATAELRLHLDRERQEPDARVLSLPFPVQNPRIVAKLLMLDLEARPPGAAVKAVKVEAIPAKPRVIQNGLFIPLSPEPEKLELTLARIATVVGEGNVGKVEIADSHARDRFRMKRFGQCGIRISEFGYRNSNETMALRLWRPALEATVQLESGEPAWIAFSEMHGAIEMASGPWNSSGDWWNRRQWDREEWDIEMIDGALLRIFKDCASNRWYAEGIYD